MLPAVAPLFAQAALPIAQRLPPLGNQGGWLEPPETLLQVEPGSVLQAPPLPGAADQRGLQVVQVLQPFLETAARMNPTEPARELACLVARKFQPPGDELAQ